MLELCLDIIEGDDFGQYSGSAFELGDNAAAITWDNAKERAESLPWVTDENRGEYVDYFASFGAWERWELESWDNVTLCALALQFIAGNAREFSDDCFDAWDWEDYEERASAGSISGNIFRGDDGKPYAYLGC